ncbi:MAG: hypothetical protein IJK41_11380, partial [Muribaculaceae bacterium]|nr:hypothetical protein [Muribaculaceae bacterium]
VCLQFAQAFPKLGGTSANRANSFAFSLHKLSRAKARLYYHVAIMTQRPAVGCLLAKNLILSLITHH